MANSRPIKSQKRHPRPRNVETTPERTKATDSRRSSRRDRMLAESGSDPYQTRTKVKEPAICPDCHAVLQSGRWTWAPAPLSAHEHRCPACQRIEDDMPQALLTLSGSFLRQHREEILHLVRNYEERERSERPLKRIMSIEERDGRWLCSFTDAHLARGIADALHRAYQGVLQYQFSPSDLVLRVSWTR